MWFYVSTIVFNVYEHDILCMNVQNCFNIKFAKEKDIRKINLDEPMLYLQNK
jgi:hypothetical protein